MREPSSRSTEAADESMDYWVWLLLLSLAFVVLERIAPERSHQRLLRPGLWTDFGYLLLHGWFWSLCTAGVVATTTSWARIGLDAVHLLPARGVLDSQGFLVQFTVFLLVSDFLQWSIHNLLHRVPWLWKFHQVHHSVQTMDWAGNFRFHWMETLVYKSLQYLPLLWLGGESGPLFWVAVFTTAYGHFNHSNLKVGLGPLAYLLNSPRMHLWHHDRSTEGGVAKNFAIVFSLWDWLFQTAYWPSERTPEQLGFPGIETMPTDLPRQILWPLLPRPAPEATGRATGPDGTVDQ